MLTADIWGPAGVALALVAIVIGGILTWWFARGPRLVMQVSGSTLISRPSDHRITVLYRDTPVPRVTQSLVWLWREGRGTIREADIVSSDPITLHVLDGERVLDADVVAQTRPTNGVSIDVGNNGERSDVKIGFTYLDSRQGALIEVIHTAESPAAISASGTILGIPKGITHVTTDTQIKMPVGVIMGTSIEVTVPTHIMPRSLRGAAGAHTERRIDFTPSGVLKTILRILFP